MPDLLHGMVYSGLLQFAAGFCIDSFTQSLEIGAAVRKKYQIAAESSDAESTKLEPTGHSQFNAARAVRFALVGGLIIAPLGYCRYVFLDHLLPGQTLIPIVQKTLVNNIFYMPAIVCVGLGVNEFLKPGSKPSDSITRIRAEFGKIICLLWSVRMFGQAFAFMGSTPWAQQVLAVIVSSFCNIYTSWRTNVVLTPAPTPKIAQP
eukprot:NODE_1172_length_1066_cov_72.353982_g907_i0.p1 GENE.NODE_1172_length_1066_cov_72.353982_g907_i0~~NODE_1172_length_1066_cov_72.353982_g907_i0.p1  ORF type:complete len:224 (-),score=60.22 NODE_1172_length_1066_cov_72.353982_g907_i0:394-1008(-)